MLYFERIYVSEGIDVNKTSESKECDICHYWYFLNKRFKFHLYVYSGCHDVPMIPVNLSNIAILNIHSADYCCNISRTSKIKAIKLMQNIDLT